MQACLNMAEREQARTKLPLWTRTEWYYQGAAEELGIDYAKGLMKFASPWGLIAVALTTAIAGFVGIQFAAKVIKSGKK